MGSPGAVPPTPVQAVLAQPRVQEHCGHPLRVVVQDPGLLDAEDLMSPLPLDGPFGAMGKSFTQSQLKTRSRMALNSYAWNAISEGTARILWSFLPYRMEEI